MFKHPHPRVLDAPSGSFFLFGPRGTGKSTWLKATFPDAPRFDLLDESVYQSFLADPGLFSAELRALPSQSFVVVDEVQRVPALLNEVHRAIEDRGMAFALCGSSSRKLKTAGTNLLAGRAVLRRMHPFLPEELGAEFDLEAAIRIGTLPVVLGSPDPEDALRAYARMYLKEEIQAEALVRNLPGFARFLPVAALFHGQVLNVSSLARDAGVARTTVLGYLEMLEDTLVAYRLKAFTARLRVKERKHPKLYWVDAGLVRALKNVRGQPAPEERGHLFEGFVAGVLRAYRDYRGLFDDWYYWAPSGGSRVEVDFLLQRGSDFVAIEVKGSARPSRAESRGLAAIAELPGVCRRILVYPGDRTLRLESGIEVLPFDAFLREIESGTLFP
jgi:predicted AAA+ superfamily ATPase